MRMEVVRSAEMASETPVIPWCLVRRRQYTQYSSYGILWKPWNTASKVLYPRVCRLSFA